MRAVNLLSEQNRGDGVPTILTTKSVLAGGATLVTAVGLACGVTFAQNHDRASDRRDTLAGLQRQVDALGVASDRTAAAKSSDSARVAAFTTAASARMRWDNLLDDVSRVLPAGSWLSSLDMQSSTAAPATASPTPATPTARPPRPRSPPRASRSPPTSSPA